MFLGKAAKNVNGVTLHAAFDVNRTNEFLPLGDKKLAEYRHMFSELALVVIDEFSMMDSNKHHSIHKRLADILQSDESFGGVGIAEVGDPLQLEPCSHNYIFQEPTHKPYQPFYEVKKLWQEFDVINLKVNHRQGEKNQWTTILNKIRVGDIDQEVKETLESRLISPPNDDTKKSKLSRKVKKSGKKKHYKVTQEDLTTAHIFYTNKDVNEHNAECLNFLQTEQYDIEAIQALPKGFKSTIKHGLTIDDTAYAKTLSVKVGARIVLIQNLNTADGLVNGAMGKVVGIEMKDSKVDCIVVAFDDDVTGIRQRQKYPGTSAKYASQNGTPIFKQLHEYLVRSKSTGSKAKILQFPIRLAFALTCHKMQGATIKKGCKTIVHWHNNLPKAMAYVM